MLKKRDLNEVPALFELMSHPEVFPYVRQKAQTSDEFYFITKNTIEAEESGTIISRTILDDCQHPIGTITLFDFDSNHGFLATWIGQPYFGQGYNQRAKEQFFDEVFFNYDIEGIYLKVRKSNTRSLKAVVKLPYVAFANTTHPEMYKKINNKQDLYDLFIITKEHYASYRHFAGLTSNSEEDVS